MSEAASRNKKNKTSGDSKKHSVTTTFEMYQEEKFLEASDVGYGRSKVDPKFLEDIKQNVNRKASIYYSAHSYPTKVPVENIATYIIENTKPGDTVLDPFCGSGMTGLAARLTGRNAAVSDIGTLALHLATNHNRFCDSKKLKSISAAILARLRSKKNPYTIKLSGVTVEISHTIFSEVLECRNCQKDILSWAATIDPVTKGTRKRIECPHCRVEIKGQSLKKLGSEPVILNYLLKGKHFETSVTPSIARTLKRSSPKKVVLPVDDLKIAETREMFIRSALHLRGVKKLSDFYSPRNLSALSSLYSEISLVEDKRIRSALMFAFTNTAWHASLMRRYNSKGGHRPLTGTLYIPQIVSEGNVFHIFENKIRTLSRYYENLSVKGTCSSISVSASSALDLRHITTGSINYIFTDPPFGSNIFYADCNFLAEAWLGRLTHLPDEAVINKSQKSEAGGKSRSQYKEMMKHAFAEMARVLKPGGKAHVVFNNTDGDIWSDLVEAMGEAGFSLKKASPLNKIQKSVKGYKSGTENTATTDLVLELENSRSPETTKSRERSVDDIRIAKAFRNYKLKFSTETNHKFVVSDFFAYFLIYAHNKNLSLKDVTFARVRNVLGAQQSL